MQHNYLPAWWKHLNLRPLRRTTEGMQTHGSTNAVLTDLRHYELPGRRFAIPAAEQAGVDVAVGALLEAHTRLIIGQHIRIAITRLIFWQLSHSTCASPASAPLPLILVFSDLHSRSLP